MPDDHNVPAREDEAIARFGAAPGAVKRSRKAPARANGEEAPLSHNAAQGADRAKPKAKRFPWIWLDEANPDLEADYCIKGIIERGRFILIYGPPGDGKTFFTIDLGAHIAGAIPWRGRRTKAGLVIYVAAEAGVSICRRFFAWRQRNIGEAADGRIPLAIVTRGANLLNLADLDGLLEELRAISADCGLPIALVIFDTLSRSIPGGNENAPEDMTRVIGASDAIRDELGAATAMVHHAGKDASKGARGHSSLFGAADTVISVIERVATLEKARDGVEGERFPFALEVANLGEDVDGDPVTTCLVRHLDAPPRSAWSPEKLSGVAKIAFGALGEAISEQGETLPATSAIPPGVRAVTIPEWRARFKLRYGSDNDGGERDQEAIKKAFTRAREQLAKAEAIMIANPYVWPTR